MEHLKAAQRQLVKKQEELAMVQEELNTLQSKYNSTRIDRDKLENRILQTKKRLDRAKVLIEALSGEKERWTDLVAGLNEAAPSLMGDTLVSTAAIGKLKSENSDSPRDRIYIIQTVQCRTSATFS